MEHSEQLPYSPFSKLKIHGEMYAAIISGVLILTAWFAGKAGSDETSVILYLLSFVIGGFAKAKEGITETLAEKKLNVELLMIFAAIGSAMIGYWTEGAILIFIFALSGALETYTMNKSKKELSALMDLQPEEAWLIQNDGQIMKVPLSDLKVGMKVLIKTGERVPIDGKIVKGTTTIDESAISGESIPVTKTRGDEIFAGTVNLTGAVTCEMTKPTSETLFQKIINLVQSAQSEQPPSQQFIEKFEGHYVKAVLIAVAIMMFLPHYILGWDWNTTFYRAIVLLVVASPCALVASIMPAALSAISNGARNGILFKGGLHLENLSNVKAIAFDKTGTLTNGLPAVTDFEVKVGVDRLSVLTIIGAIESNSNHPLAKALTAYVTSQGIGSFPSADIKDMPGFGMEAVIEEKRYRIGKGDFIGQSTPDAFIGGQADRWKAEGKTVIFLADDDGILAAIAMKDTIRQNAKRAIELLNKNGISTIMLTGDHETTAKAIAMEAGIKEYIADCLPESKVDYVKQLKEKHGGIAMVGDGINDAPALATASTGIAMGEGTDVALETADIVLMKNDLSRIEYALRLSKKTQKIIKQNIFFSIAVIALLIFSNFSQALSLPMGVIGHEGSTILVILNGLRLLRNV